VGILVPLNLSIAKPIHLPIKIISWASRRSRYICF